MINSPDLNGVESPSSLIPFWSLPGIKVRETSLLPKGSGICLPGLGIWVSSGLGNESKIRLIQHEYGHYLDYLHGLNGDRKRLFGSPFLGFYFLIGLPSLLNLLPGFSRLKAFKGDHRTFWTETRANQLAKEYFANQLAADFEKYFPLA